jgi:hypothetical protein
MSPQSALVRTWLRLLRTIIDAEAALVHVRIDYRFAATRSFVGQLFLSRIYMFFLKHFIAHLSTKLCDRRASLILSTVVLLPTG